MSESLTSKGPLASGGVSTAPFEALVVGSEIAGPTRVMTKERIRWYGDGMLSAAAGVPKQVGSNIHTDEEYARSQGLPGVIADGMISTNWISSMLLMYFGRHYLERGELRTKFIKPVFRDVVVAVRGQVTAIEPLSNGSTRYVLAVWCEDEQGNKLTVGEAKIEVLSQS